MKNLIKSALKMFLTSLIIAIIMLFLMHFQEYSLTSQNFIIGVVAVVGSFGVYYCFKGDEE